MNMIIATLLLLGSVFLIIEGALSIIHFRNQKWFIHLGRTGRILLGLVVLATLSLSFINVTTPNVMKTYETEPLLSTVLVLPSREPVNAQECKAYGGVCLPVTQTTPGRIEYGLCDARTRSVCFVPDLCEETEGQYYYHCSFEEEKPVCKKRCRCPHGTIYDFELGCAEVKTK